MPYTVTVEHLPESITENQINDFFSFCGKVNKVTIEDVAGADGKKASVEFEKAAAVKTALLLTDSELGGSKVIITADDATIEAAEGSGDGDSPTHGSEENEKDISQEYKPRSAILAEYLSHGYVLGDKVIARGLDLDAKHGISNRFITFLKDLDGKYHVKDKALATDNAYGITDKALKGRSRLMRYFDQALNTQTGVKLNSYYTGLVKEAQDVHAEARRLANMKEGDNSQESQSQTSQSESTTTTNEKQ